MPARRVLVVASATRLANALLNWLAPAGYEVVLATTYAAGREQLALHPDVLITDLKLGEFNGLQLVLHANTMDIPSIVLRVDDPVLQREAQCLGAAPFTSAETLGERVRDAIATTAVPAMVAENAGRMTWRTFDTEAPLRSSTAPSRRLIQH